MNHFQIAIDGPAGAGKSTIAKEISRKLNIIYLDTGALYRSIAYYVLNFEPNIEKALQNIQISVEYIQNSQQILLNGENITSKIRDKDVSLMASNVSKNAKVREFLLSLQRDIAKKSSVVMDGRDIGTVVLKDATVKIFLTADNRKRAMRRFLEVCDTQNITFEQVLEDMQARDEQDQNRDIAPLKPALDAIIVDTSELTLEQSIDKIFQIISERI